MKHGDETAPAKPSGRGGDLPPFLPGRLPAAIGKIFCDPPWSEFTLWRLSALNATFAVLAFLLLAAILWAVLGDHGRDWKRFTAEWRAIQEKRSREAFLEEEKRLGKAGLEGLERELREIRSRLSSDEEYGKLRREALRAEDEALLAEGESKLRKAALLARKDALEEALMAILGRTQGDPEASEPEIEALEKDYDLIWARPCEEALRQAEVKRAVARELGDRVRKMEMERDQAERRIADLTAKRRRLERDLREAERSFSNALRNAPLVPPYGPTDRIEKVILPDLPVILGDVMVPRIDRCKTCHLNADLPDPDLSRFEEPGLSHGGRLFRSHPRLDLYVGQSSPHPYEKYGCTICHGGDGRALGFSSAGHTPGSDVRRIEWEKAYSFHRSGDREAAMLPLPDTEAACAKCHPAEDRIRAADRLSEGRELVERSGCFGCHRIRGFEGRRKIGPSLRRVASKVEARFLFPWIRDPAGFRHATRMPGFFGLLNGSSSLDILDRKGEPRRIVLEALWDVEALALASSIEKRSEPRPAAEVYRNPIASGDPARGRELVRRIGCLGCHSIAREGWTENTQGPDLGGLGSKVRKAWLEDWLVDPRRYDPGARMPSLRLLEGERGEEKLADLTAYLMGLRDPAFDGRSAPALDGPRREILRDLVFEFEKASSSRLAAMESVDRMADGELLLDAGMRLASHFGCSGCHEGLGEGSEPSQPIGPELSEVGSKEVGEFDFARWGRQRSGESAIEPSRKGWIRAKVTSPRLFDTLPRRTVRSDGTVAYEPSGENLKKTPGELLRMPRFSFLDLRGDPGKGAGEGDPDGTRERRIDSVVTFLLSRERSAVPLSRERRLDGDGEALEAGRRLLRSFSCQGCHRIGIDPRWVPGGELPSSSSADAAAAGFREREAWLFEALRAGDAIVPPGTLLSTEFKAPGGQDEVEAISVADLAARSWEARGTPERERRLWVLGFGEGRVRAYSGWSAEVREKAPPLLRKEGERVEGRWLFRYLLDVRPIRPWLEIRMPSFPISREESEALVRWFKVTAGAPYPPPGLTAQELGEIGGYFFQGEPVPYPPIGLGPKDLEILDLWFRVKGSPPYPGEIFPEWIFDEKSRKLAEQGRELFQVTFPGDPRSRERLQCNTCHGAGSKRPAAQDPNSQGPDLTTVRERLRPPWISRWLLDPRSYVPDTRMPNHFVTFGDPLEPLQVLRPGYREEIEALVAYLMHLSELDEKTKG